MNLHCTVDLASAYKARPQIVRVLTEDWCSRELYCPACDSGRVFRSKANTPAIDFSCHNCKQSFQLKSQRTWNLNRVVDAGYDAMIRAIREDRTPNLLLLQYTSDWRVANLLLIPRVFFTESVIEKRNPLSANARRSGWTGCNIILSRIPNDGKIAIVSSGVPEPEERVRKEFERIRGLASLTPSLRGWTLDVLKIIRALGKCEFSLQDVYDFEAELQAAHPQNRNVRPKIRQQLQVLRKLALLEFKGRGCYALRA